MKILAARLEDFDAVIALLQASGLPVDDLAGPVFANFLTAVDESGLAGVAGIERLADDEALLRSLAVRDDCRGRGVGRALAHATERRAQALGIGRLFLLTETAEHFFAALGYQCIDRGAVPDSVARSAQFTTLCPASATCMRKQLNI